MKDLVGKITQLSKAGHSDESIINILSIFQQSSDEVLGKPVKYYKTKEMLLSEGWYVDKEEDLTHQFIRQRKEDVIYASEELFLGQPFADQIDADDFLNDMITYEKLV